MVNFYTKIFKCKIGQNHSKGSPNLQIANFYKKKIKPLPTSLQSFLLQKSSILCLVAL